jgi:hypothetical protein
MKAGIVIYRRDAGMLLGQWAHEDTGGVLARETVYGVPPGEWQGDWAVDIFLGEEIFFKGRLNSTGFGDCLKLTWQGQLVKDGSACTFQGIGRAIDNEIAAASFERIG